jgi:hypothetical protein
LDKVSLIADETTVLEKPEYLKDIIKKAFHELDKIYVSLQDSLRKDFQLIEEMPKSKLV